jgi:hypothetical protein
MGKLAKWIAASGGSDVVAKKLGCTGAAIRYWLRGRGSPRATTIETLIKLSKGKLTFKDIVTESRRNT